MRVFPGQRPAKIEKMLGAVISMQSLPMLYCENLGEVKLTSLQITKLPL
jgi:hypothetical protein